MKKQLLLASCFMIQLFSMEIETELPRDKKVRSAIRKLKKESATAPGSRRFASKIALGDFKTACSRSDYIIRCEYSKQILKNHGLLTNDDNINEHVKSIACTYFNRGK